MFFRHEVGRINLAFNSGYIFSVFSIVRDLALHHLECIPIVVTCCSSI